MEAPKEIRTIDYLTDTFGDYPFIRSAFQSHRKWTALAQVDELLEGQEVLVRARVHNSTGKGNNCFIVLRENFSTLQACAFKSEAISKDMIKYMTAVPCESIVDIVGRVVKPEKPILSCSQKVELQIVKFFVVNRAVGRLPLQIADASRKVENNEMDYEENEEPPKVEEAKVEEAKVEEVKVEEAKVEEAKVEGKTEETAEGEAKEEKGAGKEKKPKKEKKKRE